MVMWCLRVRDAGAVEVRQVSRSAGADAGVRQVFVWEGEGSVGELGEVGVSLVVMRVQEAVVQ